MKWTSRLLKQELAGLSQVDKAELERYEESRQYLDQKPVQDAIQRVQDTVALVCGKRWG